MIGASKFSPPVGAAPPRVHPQLAAEARRGPLLLHNGMLALALARAALAAADGGAADVLSTDTLLPTGVSTPTAGPPLPDAASPAPLTLRPPTGPLSPDAAGPMPRLACQR